MSVELEYDYEKVTAGLSNFNQSDIDDLRKWIIDLDPSKAVPKNLTDKQLLLFNHACYFKMDNTKKCIENYYYARKNAPEHFDNRDLDSNELRPSTESLEFSILPHRTADNYDILFHQLYHTEPSKYVLDAGIRLLLMTGDAAQVKRGPADGLIILFDMHGVKLTHLTRLSMSSLRKFFFYLQEAMPVRMKAIHVMNSVSFIDKLMAILKPFMNKYLLSLIHFHTGSVNMEQFYKDVIPKHCLPAKYGGDLPETDILSRENLEVLREIQPYFVAEEAQRAAARPPGKKNKSKSTNFSNLEID